MITEREMFTVNKMSNNAGGSGNTIIATMNTSPMASEISLFFNNSETFPKFICYLLPQVKCVFLCYKRMEEFLQQLETFLMVLYH